MTKFKLLLVDDHALVRAGIKSLIDQLDGFVVVAEASGIAEAMGKLANPSPDIVITDIDMGIDNGLDLVRKIKKQMPEALVVILSMHSPQDQGFMYGHAFQDLDGHIWEFIHMAPDEEVE